MGTSIIRRLKREPTPLIDGNTATFIWKGERAPDLVGDFNGWDLDKPIRLAKAEPGIWTHQLVVPVDAYIEYSFIQDADNLHDPNNPRLSPNGIGGNNNYFQMPEYQPTSLTKKKNVPHGKITRHVVQTEQLVYGPKRTVYLYQPPVDAPVPLLVVWDGQDYLNRIRLNYMVDNLIAERRIQPLAMALVKNGGPSEREIEYACNEYTLVFLINEVIPAAREQLNLIDIKKFPGTYGVAGSSMGGLMALYTAARFPRIFGNALSQSGAFMLGGLDMVVFDLLEQGERRPLKIWLDVGLYDIPELLTANRRMKNMLDRRGYWIDYREYHAGHNYPAWRDEIWRGLVSLFGIHE